MLKPSGSTLTRSEQGLWSCNTLSISYSNGSNASNPTPSHLYQTTPSLHHAHHPITQTKWYHIPITFSAQDVDLTSFPHNDAMVVTAHIDQWDVAKILVDNGSQAEILFL
jgi:hypothetical protein